MKSWRECNVLPAAVLFSWFAVACSAGESSAEFDASELNWEGVPADHSVFQTGFPVPRQA